MYSGDGHVMTAPPAAGRAGGAARGAGPLVEEDLDLERPRRALPGPETRLYF